MIEVKKVPITLDAFVEVREPYNEYAVKISDLKIEPDFQGLSYDVKVSFVLTAVELETNGEAVYRMVFNGELPNDVIYFEDFHSELETNTLDETSKRNLESQLEFNIGLIN